MRYLSLTIVVFMMTLNVIGQTSPHGKSLQIDCAQCHTSQNWKVNPTAIQFNHDNTNFKLVGQHIVTNCKDCHLTLTFKDGRRNCLDCHTDAHNQSLGKDCEKCHTPKSWIISDVTSMHQKTRFPLLGAHRTVNCSDCHKSASNFLFEPLGIECVNCHNTDFQKTTSPNHVTNKYSTFCLDCHNENSSSWRTTLISHEFFPLTGGHNVGCGLCHTTSRYTKIDKECNTCHNKQYLASQVPAHSSAGIPKECATCHTAIAWKPSSFNHTGTGYELKGAHKLIVQCSQCHKGNVTTATQVCIGCHQAQYDVAPSHKSSGFSTDCSKCHSQDNWLSANFDHSTTTFPLTGAHTKVLCAICHVNGYTGTSTACSSCHLPAYTSSQLPGHVAAGIPKECATCHTTAVWKPSTFNHTITGYELKGAHKLLVQCSDCHKGNVTSAALTCVGCHQAKYDAAPNHKAQGYPIDCTICHTQNNWLENSFNHSTTAFPLTGAHTTVLCSKCHVTTFKGTSTLCFTCHATKYNASTNPNHLAAKFPTNCEICHSTMAWTPSTYNHDAQYFPINSGRHKGAWTLCTECHTVATNYATFSCIVCHTHSNKASIDSDHKGIKDYTYTGTSCYTCHPRGNTN